MSALDPDILVIVQNDSGMLIPARSVVVVTSVTTEPTGPGQETESIHHIAQYSGQQGNILVTDVAPILIGQRGVAYTDQFIYVTIDTGVSVPVSGETWGPTSGQWYITRGGSGGFVAEGYSATGANPDRSMFYRTAAVAATIVQFVITTAYCSECRDVETGSGSITPPDTGTGTGPGHAKIVIAYGTAINTVCGGQIPTGQLQLYDDECCYLVGNTDLLVGLRGKAIKMKGGNNANTCDGCPRPKCYWSIISLPCLGNTCTTP